MKNYVDQTSGSRGSGAGKTSASLGFVCKTTMASKRFPN